MYRGRGSYDKEPIRALLERRGILIGWCRLFYTNQHRGKAKHALIPDMCVVFNMTEIVLWG